MSKFTLTSRFRQVLTNLDKFGQAWTRLGTFGQDWTSFDKFEPILSLKITLM